MRPFPGDEALTGQSRSASLADNDTTPLATRREPPQMTFFLADEKTMEAALSNDPAALPKQRDVPKGGSTYGVESLETTISSLSHDSDDSEEKLRHARHNWKKNLGLKASSQSEEDLTHSVSPSQKSSGDVS